MLKRLVLLAPRLLWLWLWLWLLEGADVRLERNRALGYLARRAVRVQRSHRDQGYADEREGQDQCSE
jgi:hypothetical protein